MPIYQIDGLTPVVPEESYVHPTAVLIGDVILGKGVYVGPNASLRGDFGRIVVKDGANIQDNCVMHGFPGQDTVVEEEGHIGHGAILHGCVIGRNALVGMSAVIIDGAVAVSSPRSGIEVVRGGDKLTEYRFNTGEAVHFFCSVCGIYTFHQRRSNPQQYGVNVACIDGVSPFDFPCVEVNDGVNHPKDGGGGVVGYLRYEKK
ncbi:TPA: hypothetical protein MCA42_000881 [Klebsiella pneumoniae]|nr:hypothetical protein [Klebsiella pneumoniae]